MPDCDRITVCIEIDLRRASRSVIELNELRRTPGATAHIKHIGPVTAGTIPHRHYITITINGELRSVSICVITFDELSRSPHFIRTYQHHLDIRGGDVASSIRELTGLRARCAEYTDIIGIAITESGRKSVATVGIDRQIIAAVVL